MSALLIKENLKLDSGSWIQNLIYELSRNISANESLTEDQAIAFFNDAVSMLKEADKKITVQDFFETSKQMVNKSRS